MANKDAPFGFRPVGELGSDIQNGGTTQYRIANAYASNIFKGDLVFVGDGAIVDQAGNAPTKGTLGVSANTTTISIGVFNGCYYIAPTTKKPTWSNYYPASTTPASGNIDAFVYDDPNKLYEVQASGILTDPTTIGSNCDQAYAAGATINGQSKSELGALTAAGATAQWVVVGLSKDPDNSDASVANANWIVRLNEGRYLKTTLTAAYP